MAEITTAIVANTTATTVGTIEWDPVARTVTDTDTTTTWQVGGNFTGIQFIYTQAGQVTPPPTVSINLSNNLFTDCIFTPDSVNGFSFAGTNSRFVNCIFRFSGEGDANAASYFGNGAETAGATSVLTDCEWVTFGQFNALDRQWSIALTNISANITNPEFNDSFITDVTTGAVNFGWAHDGTLRSHPVFTNRFSIRNQQATEQWAAYVQGSFANGNYTTDETDATSGSHYSANAAGNRTIYTINQTYTNWDTTTEGEETYVISALSGTGAGTIYRDGYTWNPRFIESGTVGTLITDAAILNIPAGVTASTLNLTTFAQDALLPAFTGGAWDSSGNSVLLLQSGSATASNTALATVQKALDQDGNLRTNFIVNPRIKSYSHLGGTVATGLNLFDSYSGGVEGDFAITSTSDTFFPADTNLAGQDLATNATAAAALVVSQAEMIYPALKSVWYYGTLDENFQPTIPLGTFTTNRNLLLGTANLYTGASVAINAGAVLTGSANVNTLSAPSISIGDTGFNGITINGATTGNFGALSNETNITTSNAAAQTIASIDNSSIISTGALTVSGDAAESIIQSTGGTVTVSGTSTDNDIDAGGTVTVNGYSTRGTVNNTSGQVDLLGGGEDTVTVSAGHTDLGHGAAGLTYTRINASAPNGNSDVRAHNQTLVDCVLSANRDVVLMEANVSGGTYTAVDDIQAEDSTISAGTFRATDEIDLDNATITGGTFESVDDIVLNNATVTGGVFTTNDALNAEIRVQDATISNAHLTAHTIALLGPNRLIANNIIGMAGRNTRLGLNYVGTATATIPQILGTNYTVEADAVTWTNGPGTVTITVTETEVAALNILDPDTGNQILPNVVTTEVNGVIFSYPVDSDTTFTCDPSPDGGNFVVFSRTLPTDSWVAGTPVAVAANTAGSIVINNVVGEYLAVWKPSNSTTYTSFRHEVFAATPVTDPPPFNVSTTTIPTEVLSTATVPTNVLDGTTNSIWSMPATGVFDGQLLLEIVNATGVLDVAGPPASSSTPRLDGGQTQSLLRSGLATQAYFNFVVENTNNLVPIDVAEFDTSVNFIRALTPTSTRVNGDYLELNTKDGTQQKITAVENTSETPITGKISATIDATTTTDIPGTPTTSIEFDAVDIADNPMGITLAEVRNAVKVLTDDLSAEHGVITQNQQNNKVAIQRGAVKAATYSAPALTDTDTGNVFP